MDSAALNRALCEKLGIAPITRTCTCGHDRDEHLLPPLTDPNMCYGDADIFRQCPCPGFTEQSADYPPLSTTGEGMLRLMEALEKAGHSCTIYSGGVGYVSGRLRVAASAPMALALAAAAALGIEVQP